jgi:hypothetical protein
MTSTFDIKENRLKSRDKKEINGNYDFLNSNHNVFLIFNNRS